MLLEAALHHPAYVDAILLLVKNILTRPKALYSVKEWSSQFDPKLVYGGNIGGDKLARALDRLYEIDRASLMTIIVMRATQSLQIDTSQIHHDTTSVKLSGAYENQDEKAVQLKRGHSKDHRPDLKQLIYSLCVAADGALPIHFKTYDGNKTDDSLHIETWQSLRGILDRSDFLYVADSKLCTHENLKFIDRNQGKFITVLPRTRRETKTFAEQLSLSLVRWDNIYSKRSSRKSKRIDLYESAQGLFQMQEGYRIYWYRSSEKTRRDEQSREERLALAKSRLRRLGDIKRRGPKTEASLQKAAQKILTQTKTQDWLIVEVALEEREDFKALGRGKPTKETRYRKIRKWIPRLNVRENLEALSLSKAQDGVFPLVTNAELSDLEVLQKYKYQPKIEKRHSLLKSVLQVSPVFLKKNDRIEALMFVYFIAQTIAAALEREVRMGMKQKNMRALNVLPEERPSTQPTAEQILRVFEPRTRHLLYEKEKLVRTFTDPLTQVQKEVMWLIRLPLAAYQ